jgi:hypothetical protein
VKQLAKSLAPSASIVDSIEYEIDQRSQLVEKLQRDAARYEQLKNLNQATVEAVAQTLRGELATQGRKSFWQGVWHLRSRE